MDHPGPRPPLVISGSTPERGLTVGGDRPPRLMAIVNLTPDSFSDGGVLVDSTGRVDVAGAVDACRRLLDEGADLLDLGGESTRPGYESVPAATQIERVVPVVAALREAGIDCPISIDTTRAAVASAALAAGADWINDTTALGDDPELAEVAARAACPVVLMHRFAAPRRWDAAADPDVVRRIADGLSARVDVAVAAGIERSRIVVDPGIGFGTSVEDSLALHRDLSALTALGLPLLFGPSRKSFLGRILGGERPPTERVFATAASVAFLAALRVEILRVHDVAEMRDVVDIAVRLAR